VTLIVLEVPLRTPSLNEFNRAHWSRYHKIKKRWQSELQIARMKARLFGRPQFPKATILFERFAVQPILDTDNRVAGLKPAIDAMVDNGILLADDDQHVSYSIVEIRVSHRKEERTRITITPG
jgi:Holliday junction resolvase RusA-like endonuclease